MSAALKRRFNFETLHAIGDIKSEMALIKRETDKLFAEAGLDLTLPEDVLTVLTRTFHELRTGKTGEGQSLEPLSSVMSVAEAISTGYAAGLHAHYYENSKASPAHIAQAMLGTAVKDSSDDQKKMLHYFNQCVSKRSESSWRTFYEARKVLL